VRPVRDAVYALTLVICPGCGSACVRRRHPLQRWTRSARSAVKAALVLTLQCLALFMLASIAVASIGELEFMTRPRNILMMLSDERWALLSMAVLQVFVGMWLTAGLSHWRRWTPWAAWAGLIACLLSIELIVEAPGPPPAEVLGVPLLPGSLEFGRLVHRLAILGAVLIIAAAGIPLGLMALKLHAKNRAIRWRKRRRRLRRERLTA
jgi:hypothetical protein